MKENFVVSFEKESCGAGKSCESRKWKNRLEIIFHIKIPRLIFMV